jgi:hypothetical protein
MKKALVGGLQHLEEAYIASLGREQHCQDSIMRKSSTSSVGL